MSKRFVNKFVLNCVPENFKWYERDGLRTYIDQLKYSEFSSDPDKYLKEADIVNFDMIHERCGRHKRSMTDKHYQTIVSVDVKNMPQKERKKALSACVRSDRKELFVEICT